MVYPNPYVPEKAVDHVLKFDGVPADTTIRIYTISGELVREFNLVQGRVLWDGTNQDGSKVVSGVYVYTIKVTGRELQSGKLFVIR